MTEVQKCQPVDDTYECDAVVTISNGKATVELASDFTLPVGTRIELANQPEGSAIIVDAQRGSGINGHSII